MKPIPYVLIKSAMSLDGFIGNSSDERLILSNKKDFAEVEKIRANYDAILVGANTIRKDNPQLILKEGTENPKKITITSTGNLDPNSKFFTTGNSEKIVYTPDLLAPKIQNKFPNATVVGIEMTSSQLRNILEDLYNRGVKKLLIEGGSSIITQFLNEDLVDEVQISIAPFLLGQLSAPRFVNSNLHTKKKLYLESMHTLDDMSVLTYKVIKNQYEKWIKYVINLSQKCPPANNAFSVGAALVDENGNLVADGYSREDPKMHAEEIIFQKIQNMNLNLSQTTLYSSLEPCNSRRSKSESCVDLILKTNIKQVIFAATEPAIFMKGHGADRLRKSGKEVVVLSQYENEVIEKQSPTIQTLWKKTQ